MAIMSILGKASSVVRRSRKMADTSWAFQFTGMNARKANLALTLTLNALLCGGPDVLLRET